MYVCLGRRHHHHHARPVHRHGALNAGTCGARPPAMLPTMHPGNALLDLLTARRDAILAAYRGELPPALAARRLDGLLASLHDDPAVTQRGYADNTLKPELRAGLTLE